MKILSNEINWYLFVSKRYAKKKFWLKFKELLDLAQKEYVYTYA